MDEEESACGEGVEVGRGEECAQSEGVQGGQGESSGCLGDEEKTVPPPSQGCHSKLQASQLDQHEAKQNSKVEKQDKYEKVAKPPDPAFLKPPDPALLKPPTVDRPKPKPRGVQMKLFDSFAKVPPPTTPKAPIVIDVDGGDKEMPAAAVKREVAGGPRGRLGRKRSRGDPRGAPIVKALKQMEKRAVITCPICSQEFSDITNFDLNQHLDTCLGTQQPPALGTQQPPGLGTQQPPALRTQQPPGFVTQQPPALGTQQPPGPNPPLEDI